MKKMKRNPLIESNFPWQLYCNLRKLNDKSTIVADLLLLANLYVPIQQHQSDEPTTKIIISMASTSAAPKIVFSPTIIYWEGEVEGGPMGDAWLVRLQKNTHGRLRNKWSFFSLQLPEWVPLLPRICAFLTYLFYNMDIMPLSIRRTTFPFPHISERIYGLKEEYLIATIATGEIVINYIPQKTSVDLLHILSFHSPYEERIYLPPGKMEEARLLSKIMLSVRDEILE